jgi:mannose-6-phosphate isomerase-like protein (cupin superfamily)
MRVRVSETPEIPLPEQFLTMRRLAGRDQNNAEISVTWVKIWGRHRKMRSDNTTRVYYFLEGTGEFKLGDGEPFAIGKDDLVTIPRGTPYEFTGHMTYLVMNGPAHMRGDDIVME